MRYRVVYLDGVRSFTAPQKRNITYAIRAHSEDAVKVLGAKIDPVTYTVYPASRDFAGHVYEKKWVHLNIDVEEYEADGLGKKLAALVSHEIHHVARDYLSDDSAWGRYTLAEAAINEGLAIVFEQAQVPGWFPDYCKIDEEFTRRFLPLFFSEFHRPDYDRRIWRYGSGENWAATHKVGVVIVRGVQGANPDLSHSILVRKNTLELYTLWTAAIESRIAMTRGEGK